MNHEEFYSLLERRLQLTKDVLKSKNKEYASTTDRLHNFKVAARLGTKEITPEEALLGMLRKHLVSVFDIIESAGKEPLPYFGVIDEKIGDSINYLILLEALLMERASTEWDQSNPLA